MNLKSYQKQTDEIDRIKAMEPLQAYEAGQNSVDGNGIFALGFGVGNVALTVLLLIDFYIKGACR